MKYSALYFNDMVNGDGVRTSLFVSGCSHGCDGCYNREAWDYRYGKDFTNETVDSIIKSLDNNHVDGLSLLGGDPLARKNYDSVLKLCKRVKEVYPNKNIWLWTGYLLEDIKNNHAVEILDYVDVIIDGKFEKDNYKKMPLRGSTNQKIYKKHSEEFIESCFDMEIKTRVINN